MKHDKTTTRGRGQTKRPRNQPEKSAAAGAAELPKREALSFINPGSALPINPGLPPELLADGGAAYTGGMEQVSLDQTAAPSAPTNAPPDAQTADPRNIQQHAPMNEATATSVQSAGTTEMASATQDAPVNEEQA
jgi:hypothetical protein